MYIFIAVILAIGIGMAVLLRSPKFLGFAGETVIRRHLSSLPDKHYRVLNDLLIPRSDGKMTQIDHVVVSTFGLFVIETKNYQGLILGRDRDNEWTQILNKRTRHRFLSPVIQNRIHVRALREMLPDIDADCFHSIVVFSNGAKLRTEVTDTHVVNVRDLLRTIRSYTTPKLTEEQITQVIERIAAVDNKDRGSRREHVARIRDLKQGIEKGVCPRCGGQLVLRQGKRGEFWGCSNFPRCRFVRKA